ncbi:hypothetical protein P8C59_008644 [Phyllachora maydis]|uniref:Uncharacterized protein n=1 Tax=Phyllachora maydis TaxID=1825666 RepID=A0AAD9ICL5_9PEZI|nr:hypothetical protein P8C59_008644 [Phyllachora maydis]
MSTTGGRWLITQTSCIVNATPKAIAAPIRKRVESDPSKVFGRVLTKPCMTMTDTEAATTHKRCRKNNVKGTEGGGCENCERAACRNECARYLHAIDVWPSKLWSVGAVLETADVGVASRDLGEMECPMEQRLLEMTSALVDRNQGNRKRAPACLYSRSSMQLQLRAPSFVKIGPLTGQS